MKKVYNRIEFWILIFFLVRLIGITNPPLEISHNWRQITGLMVARNFVEVNSNILYPRIDDNNGNTGIIGMEFPTMNYVYFLLSKVFGYTHWYGRLINLIISSIGLFFYYKLICLVNIKEKIAFFSTLLLAASIWFSFSRKMMPDTYCISLMIISLYYGIQYIQNNKIYQLIIFSIVCTLAILSKIPAGIYLILLIPYIINKQFKLRNRLIISASVIITLIFTYYWYFIWNIQLAAKYGNWYNEGLPISKGFAAITQHLHMTLEKFYFDSFSSYCVFSIFIMGLILLFIHKDKKIITSFVLISLMFMIYMAKSGLYFYQHNYYIIPYVPAMALVAGYAISLIRTRWIALTILVIGIGESIANQQHDFFIKKSEKYKLSLESIMNKYAAKHDLILTNGNGNPQLMYLSHRKGWNCTNDEMQDKSFVENIMRMHCKFIVVNKHALIQKRNLLFMQHIIFENEDFIIFKNDNAIPSNL